MSLINFSLWSSVGKYHDGEGALTVAVIIAFGRFVNVLDIIEFSCICDSWVECLGGMYMFAICNCCDVER